MFLLQDIQEVDSSNTLYRLSSPAPAFPGLYHSLPEQAGEGLLSTLSHEHEVHGLDLHRQRPTIAAAHPPSAADAATSQGHTLQGLGGGGAGAGAVLVTGEAGQAGAYRGRITVYCIADALDRKALLSLLQVRFAGQGAAHSSGGRGRAQFSVRGLGALQWERPGHGLVGEGSP